MLPSSKLSLIITAILIFAVTAGGCAQKTSENDQGENTMPSKALKEVLEQHTDELMSISGVVGVGQGLCGKKPCIKVFVVKRVPELDKKIPKQLEGYAVSMEESGEIKMRPQNKK
jgi:hypothetical protein